MPVALSKQPEAARGERSPKRTPTEIVLAGEAFLTVNKRKEIHPQLKTYFSGPEGRTRARIFLVDCENSEELRRACEEQGFDLEGWKQQLDELDNEIRTEKGSE